MCGCAALDDPDFDNMPKDHPGNGTFVYFSVLHDPLTGILHQHYHPASTDCSTFLGGSSWSRQSVLPGFPKLSLLRHSGREGQHPSRVFTTIALHIVLPGLKGAKFLMTGNQKGITALTCLLSCRGCACHCGNLPRVHLHYSSFVHLLKRGG